MRRWEAYINNNRKLEGKLLQHMKREARDKVAQCEGFATAYMNRDLLVIWDVAEQITVSSGSMSIVALTMRLVQAKQGSTSFSTFCREFLDIITDLERVQPDTFWQTMDSMMFVVAVNQDFFKDKLQVVYGSRK